MPAQVKCPYFNIIGYPFTGIFEGNDHTIFDFTYQSEGENYVGLFGKVEGPGTEIKNLVLSDPNISAVEGYYIGSVGGHVRSGSIQNCNILDGTILGEKSVGGLVGSYGDGTIINWVPRTNLCNFEREQ